MNAKKINSVLVIGFVSLMVLALAGYAMFVESAKKEASSIQTVGTLGVLVTPYPATGGTETFGISYGAPGEFDFSGWTIETEAGDSHMISADPVTNGETVLVCGEEVSGLDCDDLFPHFNFLDNNVGVVTLRDASGSVVTVIDYDAPEAGQSFREAPDFKTTVFSNNASIEFCRATNQGEYTLHRGNVGTIIDGKAHADITGDSIIPSFFYSDRGVIGYFPGLNWPDETGIYANGCQ